jgi:predicted nucleic acid-binding protein
MYLLATNVVSELRKVRPHRAVLAWIHGVPEGALWISALTLGELQAGAELTRKQDAAKQKRLRCGSTSSPQPMR